jgi:hypothetical protein
MGAFKIEMETSSSYLTTSKKFEIPNYLAPEILKKE